MGIAPGPIAVALLVMLAPSGVLAASEAASGDRVHPHNGVLRPYSGPPPVVEIDDQERFSLARGRPVYKKLETPHGPRSVAIFRVDAPSEIVWSVIVDFDAYPLWIDKVAETEVYELTGEEIFVRFRLQHWLGDIQYFAHHSYPASRLGWGTWKLDYRHRSDLDDTVGFWRVDPVPGSPRQSDVTYAAEIRFKRWMPNAINQSISKQGLETATLWVKTQSERRAAGR